MLSAIVVDSKDNVATALAILNEGEPVAVESDGIASEVVLLQSVPFGHKFATGLIESGKPVIKYGEIIGQATAAIAAGEHVHVHNVEGLRGRGDKQ